LNFFRAIDVLVNSRKQVVILHRFPQMLAVSFALVCACFLPSLSFGAESDELKSRLESERRLLDKKEVSSSSQVGSESPSIEPPIKYWGNSFSLKFHRPSCPFAKAMSAHHVIFFNFRKQAVDAGQAPCRYCLPPNWNTVKAVLLKPSNSVQEPSLPSESPGNARLDHFDDEFTVRH
jgi:hypothetical protein